ncbi:tryptophan synthase subunit alpha [Saccharospirillum impatiens]|uniref:tryptophan synthase subunit alpha n=1 Tax=Saccharospirillum impatiens TaxID=169438 RepID=UPI0003F76FAE|nr:tryptophan synthase subunit alpha [Saccharospirillum impatiens]
MSRIAATFERLKNEGRKALIPFVTAGDPRPDVTLPLMHALVEQGANIIELGMPFSDPMADGPAIQRANERALANGMSLRKTLDIVAEFRKTNQDTPVVLMGYLNPVEWMGYETFVKAAHNAGVDGLLMVDMPPEEGGGIVEHARAVGLDLIYLVTPTTTNERFDIICKRSTGWIYYVSLKGITGANTLNVDEVAERMSWIEQHTDVPVCVGFGIRDGETAARVAKVCSGVIVGSVLVNAIERLESESAVEISSQVSKLLGDMRVAMDRA